MFHDLYGSLNTLDAEIRASDGLRAQTDTMRKEWIANITHDLKTPLSPIKGYAEMLQEDGSITPEQCRRYAGITLKNVSYIETLIDDLKLTYQLESGMLPVSREEQDIVRFMKELAIDILNTPEYEDRTIHFETEEADFLYSFDQTLLTRAFRNLIINGGSEESLHRRHRRRGAGKPDGVQRKMGKAVSLLCQKLGNAIKLSAPKEPRYRAGR